MDIVQLYMLYIIINIARFQIYIHLTRNWAAHVFLWGCFFKGRGWVFSTKKIWGSLSVLSNLWHVSKRENMLKFTRLSCNLFIIHNQQRQWGASRMEGGGNHYWPAELHFSYLLRRQLEEFCFPAFFSLVKISASLPSPVTYVFLQTRLAASAYFVVVPL